MRSLLEKCGKVTKWNRAADPNTNKLTSFGFCDFEDAQGIWRALEFLHEKQLCDKKLLVKCEEKVMQTIDKWKESRREELSKRRAEATKEKAAPEAAAAEGEAKDSDAKKEENEAKPEDAKKGEVKVVVLTDEELNEELRKESKEVEEEVMKLLADKNKGYEVKADAADDKEAEEAAKRVQARAEETKGKENTEKKSDTDKSKDDKRKSEVGGKRAREEEDEKDAKKRRDEEDKKAAVSRHYRQSRRERDREQRYKDKERDNEKEYSYRLREFERSEDKRIRNLKHDLKNIEPPEEPSDREKRKFVERDLDFREDDERDWKRRREDREKDRKREHEKDVADRVAEQNEIEDDKRRKKDEEERIKREAKEAEEMAKREAEDEKRRQKEAEEQRIRDEERRHKEEQERKVADEKKRVEAEHKKVQEDAAAKLLASVQQEIMSGPAEPMAKVPLVSAGPPQMSSGAQAMQKLFQEPEELDEKGQPRKHKPLTRLDGPPAAEVKLRDDEMKRLIQQVPTDKVKAFAFEIDWQAVHDHNIIEKKLRPWVKKKVTEYLGAEEQGMIEFIMRKVTAHTSPEVILRELEGFLDEEAENFTLKMWRMLIFEVLRVKAR